MKKEIVFIFVEDYPDWESAEALYFIAFLGKDIYEVKVASMTRDPIRSLSGVSILPDYDLEEVTGNFAGLVLVGGIGWTSHTKERLEAIQPIVEDAVKRACPIGGIGTGADILGAFGLLNSTVHTGNSVPEINLISELGHMPSAYAGEAFFRDEGAIRNGQIVTAKNISGLAFARAYMWTLKVSQEEADDLYEKHKEGASLPMLDMS